MTAEQLWLCRMIGDLARQALCEGDAMAVQEKIDTLANRLFE